MTTYTIKAERADYMTNDPAALETEYTLAFVTDMAANFDESSLSEFIMTNFDEHRDGMWYAAQTSTDDDWGTGSYSLVEAIAMTEHNKAVGYADALIAVIDDNDDPICIDEIRI